VVLTKCKWRGIDFVLHAASHQNSSVSQADSCITTAYGSLSDGYRYLETIMKRSPLSAQTAASSSTAESMLLSLEGHLFDSGLINQVLDVIERHHGGLHFEECMFPPHSVAESVKSKVLLRITADEADMLLKIESKVQALVELIERADATVVRVDRPFQDDDEDSAIDGSVGGSTAQVCEPKREKRVLVLGSGLVSKSTVHFLGRSEDVRITVASDHEDDAREVAAAASNGHHVALDVSNDLLQMSDLIEDADLVVSLLPAPMHPAVAQECIVHKSNLVTASYESDEMRDMNDRAREAGIVILNEVGLDPGLDHMSAMKIIDDVKARGGAVTSFSSVCGGLPAPEVANNPLQYKFSWSPRGVIRACQNSARYRRDGTVVEVMGHELLSSAQPFADFWPELHLECLPNRDSLSYEDVYSIGGASTIFRGTLRYNGFSSLMNTFQNMGLFDDIEVPNDSWTHVLGALRRRRGGFESTRDFIEACAEDVPDNARRAMQALEWLGILEDEMVPKKSSVVDAFCAVLEEHLQYQPGERDMVLMHHKIEAEFDNGTREQHLSSLRVYGDARDSAMSKTVGYTAAASAELILDGALKEERGLMLPIQEQVYRPVLAKVENEGIRFEENVSVHSLREEEKA